MCLCKANLRPKISREGVICYCDVSLGSLLHSGRALRLQRCCCCWATIKTTLRTWIRRVFPDWHLGKLAPYHTHLVEGHNVCLQHDSNGIRASQMKLKIVLKNLKLVLKGSEDCHVWPSVMWMLG